MCQNILIIGHYGMKNTGDDAMLMGIINGIFNEFPKSIVRIISTSMTANFNNFMCNKMLNRSHLFHYESRISFLFSSLIRSDLVILGGGTHFHDYMKNRRYLKVLIGYCVFFKLAKILKKKLAYIGIGIGPIETRWGRALIKFALSCADLIAVRDKYSFNLAKSLGVKKKIVLGFDPAILINKDSSYLYSKSSEIIKILGISILPFFKMYKNDPNKDKEVLINLSKAIDLWLSNDPRREVKIFVFHGPSRNDDQRFSEELLKMIRFKRNIRITEYQTDPMNMLKAVAECDIFVAMRLHAIMFAFMARKPILVLSYHPKCKYLAEEIGLSSNAIISINDIIKDKDGRLLSAILNDITFNSNKIFPRLNYEAAYLRAAKMLIELRNII